MSPDGVADVRFHPAHDMPAISGSHQPASAVHQAADRATPSTRQNSDRCRHAASPSAAVIHRLGGQHFGEPATLVFLADAMMRLIDDDQVPGGAFQFRQHTILLGRNRSRSGTAPSRRTGCRRVPARAGRRADSALSAIGVKRRPKRNRISCSHWRTSGPGGAYHQDTMRAAPARSVRPRSGRPGSSCPGRRRRPAAASAAPCRARAAGDTLIRPRSPRRPGGDGRTRDLIQQPGDVIASPGVQGAGILRRTASVRSAVRASAGCSTSHSSPCQIAAAAGQMQAPLRRPNPRPPVTSHCRPRGQRP